MDDPTYDQYTKTPAVTVPVTYESAAIRRILNERRAAAEASLTDSHDHSHGEPGSHARELVDVTYGSFVPIQQLEANGVTEHLRIGLVWELVDSGDITQGSARQCSFVGTCLPALSHACGCTVYSTGWP